jgi:hypothetical protein
MNEQLSLLFGLETRSSLSKEDILAFVQAEILRLLGSDREQLLNIAYRLDVDEEEFRSCFWVGKSAEDVASLLARLFFDREKAKVAYRHVHDKH